MLASITPRLPHSQISFSSYIHDDMLSLGMRHAMLNHTACDSLLFRIRLRTAVRSPTVYCLVSLSCCSTGDVVVLLCCCLILFAVRSGPLLLRPYRCRCVMHSSPLLSSHLTCLLGACMSSERPSTVCTLKQSDRHEAEHETDRQKHQTSNIKHQTSNIQ